jgi:hypothetical protein
MTTRIGFFATRADLLVILHAIENQLNLKYVLADSMPTPEVEEWFKCSEIPGLGLASGPQASLCKSYLLASRGRQIQARRIEQRDGVVRFDVDQMGAPDTITMTPGGEWGDEAIIAGAFSTSSSFPDSRMLMNLIGKTVKQHFARIRAFWVGPEALSALRAGKRLTIAMQSPRSYDLREA